MLVIAVSPDAPEDRDVLAAGVEDDLDRRVGEQLGERRDLDAVERVDQDDPSAVGLARIVDADLDQAQQRPVAAL